MISVDTSALVAIALDEPERAAFARAISDNHCLLGWPTALEAHLVLRRESGSSGIEFRQDLLNERNVAVLDFSRKLFVSTCEAFDRFGKGRHRAGLNFGDCLSYAVAKTNAVPLLYKGNDFSFTDIRPALP